ncbi:MAG: acylphosphatase [Chitinophagaceae bacterium]
MICKQITIKGLVQGVFFRASARDKAEELGLKGEVRNLRDGSVQAVACGPEDKVELLITWCRLGPPKAQVEQVIVEDMEIKAFDGFRIVRGW